MHKATPLNIEPKAFTVKESGRITGLGKTKLFALINDGTLKSVKIGRRRLIYADSVDRLLETGQDAA
jgi:excisionase family DNA binding protein